MPRDDKPHIENLWMAWSKEKHDAIAHQLIENYMYLVDFHVKRIGSNIPTTFDKKDLKSLGMIGLFDAIQKFDPSRGLSFATYGSIRIRGAMMDGLRKEDWLPRNRREQVKKIMVIRDELIQLLHRSPTRTEIAQKMQLSESEVDAILVMANDGNIYSMEQNEKYVESEGIATIATLANETLQTPDSIVEKKDTKEKLVKAIQLLNKNQQLVISLFYIEELTLTEIGEVLDLSTSRISQIHKQAISQLKEMLFDYSTKRR